jgi:hypothetical protein
MQRKAWLALSVIDVHNLCNINFAVIVQYKVDKIKETKELNCICSKWTSMPTEDCWFTDNVFGKYAYSIGVHLSALLIKSV